MIKKLFTFIVVLFIFASMVSARMIYRGIDPKYIALTFDDGPSLDYTQMVLAVLEEEQVPATFFMIGRKIKQNPWIMRLAAKAGHEIANHSYSHDKITRMKDDQLIKEIRDTSVLVHFNTSQEVKYFRPPHGDINGSKRRLIEARGYDVVLWSVNADDFWKTGRGIRTPDSIARRVLSRVTGGDIILMHDNSRQMAEALPLIIKDLKKRGFKFVTMSEFMAKQEEYLFARNKKHAE